MFNQIIENFYRKECNEIEFIFQSGSSILPYIDNPHDVDIFVVFKNRENMREKCHNICILQRQLRELNISVAVVPCQLNRLQNWLDESVPVERERFPAYTYLLRYIQFLGGEDTLNLHGFDVLSEPVRSRYIRSLKEAAVRAETIHDDNNGKMDKCIYHILTGLYILQNNSYNFTPEQIYNINLAHDKECSEELYNWVLETVRAL